jgi:hypothetical protein
MDPTIPRKNFWLFTPRKFLFIEFIFIAFYELSRLTAEYGWLNFLCGSSSQTRIYPTGSGVPQIAQTISCSDAFGGLGMKIFLFLSVVYFVSFIIYKIFRGV